MALKFNFDKLDANQKIVLSKIQCSNNLNLIDSTHGKYNPKNTPEYILADFAKENTRKSITDKALALASLSNSMGSVNQNAYQAALDNNSISAFLSFEQRKKLIKVKNQIDNSDGDTGTGEDVVHGDLISEIEDTDSFKNYIDRHPEVAVHVGNPYVTGAFGMDQYGRPSAPERDPIGEASVNDYESSTQYTTNSDYVPAVTPTEIRNSLTNNYQSLQNKLSSGDDKFPDYSDLQNSMIGDTPEKQRENLENYLSSEVPNNDLIKEKDMSKKKALVSQLRSLKDELKKREEKDL